MSFMAPGLLCLVEDDEIMGESLCDRFRLEGFRADWHKRARDAMLAIARGRYALVVCDVRLPDLGGDQMFTELRASMPMLPPFIFITGFGSIDRAVQLLKMGAADYITKPFDLDQLIDKIRALSAPHTAGVGEIGDESALGIAPGMRRIHDTLPRLAQHASTVLITGESGVGKEHVASLIHRYAHRTQDAPFVAVNCGALTESLLEAELFGYEKGAFTGAMRTKKGVFEQAHGGTLFLDEIGEMPLPMQVRLLRVLQEKRVTRVGGEGAFAVDFRPICATHRDLKKMVELGEFRDDLFYRVNVIQLRIPPLRERSEDILWFARRFLDEFAQREQGQHRTVSAEAERVLLAYPWPGNIRELKHSVERACVLSSGPELRPFDFFDEELVGMTSEGHTQTLSHYLHDCERAYIQRALARHHGQIAATAAELGISRKNLWEKMKKLGFSTEHSETPKT
jgi:DNA-binding NtrC family response regulator